MRTKSNVVAYAIAAIAVVAAIVLWFQNRDLEVRINELQMDAVEIGESPEIPVIPVATDPVEDARELTAELAEANARIATLEQQLAASDTETASTENAEAGEQSDTAHTGNEDEPRTLEEMRARLSENAAVSAQVQALTEMAYADFFGAVELDAETKNAIRQALRDSQLEQITLAQYAIQEEATGRDYGEWKREERERLNEQMRALLSPENHEVWEGYEETLDQRMLEATFENQFNAFASGLTPENHELAMTVAVEEFLEEQWALENSEETFTEADNFQFQLDAMAAMRERLQPVMEEDQFRELENWLTMGENVMRQGLNNIDEAENEAN